MLSAQESFSSLKQYITGFPTALQSLRGLFKKVNQVKKQTNCAAVGSRASLHVSFDKRSKHPVLLLQKSLRFVVLHDVASLHHNDQVSRKDGVDTVQAVSGSKAPADPDSDSSSGLARKRNR